MAKRTTILMLLAASGLAGCALAPEYEQPALPTSATYSPESRPEGSAPAATQIGWREFFTDPRLQMLIAQALDNNRDLRIAVLRIEEARAQYGIQRADQIPNIEAGASTIRSRLLPGSSAVPGSYEATLSLLSFELDFWGRVRSLKDAALANYLATEEARRAATISLIAEVGNAYLAEREFDERIALAEKSLASREESRRIAQKRFEAGITSEVDLRAAETLLTTARSDLAVLKRLRAQNRNALDLLVGAPAKNLPPPRALAEQGILQELPAGLPSDLLVNRPDVVAAEYQLKAANANIGAARAAFFPRIALTGAIGSASTEFGDLFEAGSRTWQFIPRISLPIFDGGRNKATLDLNEARKHIAVANYEKTVQVAFREVADALEARYWLAEQLAAQQRTLDAQARRARLAELRYREGVANFLEVLDAQRELFAAEQSLVQTRRELLSNTVTLYKSLGGGWRDQSASRATVSGLSPSGADDPASPRRGTHP